MLRSTTSNVYSINYSLDKESNETNLVLYMLIYFSIELVRLISMTQDKPRTEINLEQREYGSMAMNSEVPVTCLVVKKLDLL